MVGLEKPSIALWDVDLTGPEIPTRDPVRRRMPEPIERKVASDDRVGYPGSLDSQGWCRHSAVHLAGGALSGRHGSVRHPTYPSSLHSTSSRQRRILAGGLDVRLGVGAVHGQLA